jgi:hypothetical protein
MLKNIFFGKLYMSQNPKNKPDTCIPNWLLYLGVTLAVSLGAAKILWGLIQIYQ